MSGDDIEAGDFRELSDDDGPPIDSDGEMELSALGGPDVELSTGLALTWGNYLVFGLDPRAVPLGAGPRVGCLAFVGVGGHLSSGEGWCQAVTREAMEEATCSVALGDSPVTYLCREGQAPRPIRYRWREPYRPLLVWTADFKVPRGPEHRLTEVHFVNAVFRAAALQPPQPASEMSTLLLLDHATLLHAYEAPRTLEELAARGARLIGSPLPGDTLLAPGGTAYFLGQWLAWDDGRRTTRD